MSVKITIYAEILNIYTGDEKHRHLHSNLNLQVPSAGEAVENPTNTPAEMPTTAAVENTAAKAVGPVDKNGNPLRGAALQAYLRNHANTQSAETQAPSASASSETEAETPTEDDGKFAAVMAALKDERYKLRTLSELCDENDLISEDLFSMLDDNNVRYITKHRQRDGATLIGLAERN